MTGQDAFVAKVRDVCDVFPEAFEESAWTGMRWRIRKQTFAHVVTIDAGWPPAYAKAAAHDGPLSVLTFTSAGEELEVLRRQGPPFFAPPWRADVVGMALDAATTDWAEVAELLTESYRAHAPQRLAKLLEHD